MGRTAEGLKRRRSQQLEYYRSDPKRYRQYQVDYQAKDPAKRKDLVSKWRIANKDHVARYDADRYAKNKEKIALKKREHRQKNKEHYAEYQRAYYAKNKEIKHSCVRNRHARAVASEGSHDANDIARIIKDQRSRCAYCRKKLGLKYHVDHITALSRGGSNWPSNLQVTCVSCNVRKHTKSPEDFARQLGRLL